MKRERRDKHKSITPTAGVYRCTTPTGQYYIGRAVNMKQRMYNHYYAAKTGTHANRRLARCLNKYGNKMVWDVLFHADCEETALEWESNYLEMFWGDVNLMNLRKGDIFTALENERNKRKPVYVMNVWSGGVIKLNYTSEWGAMMNKGRTVRVPSSVYGDSIEECQQKRINKIRHYVRRDCFEQQYRELRRPRNKHLYFIWTKSRKWIVWGGDEAKRITSGLSCEYWVKTRTRKWKHKKPVTKAIPVRLYRIDAGEILCKSIGEASRIIGCSFTDVRQVVYGKRGRKTTKGWTAEFIRTHEGGCGPRNNAG